MTIYILAAEVHRRRQKNMHRRRHYINLLRLILFLADEGYRKIIYIKYMIIKQVLFYEKIIV